MRTPLTPQEKRDLKKQYYLMRKAEIREKRAKGEKITKEYKKNLPWYVHWDSARTRCTNPKAINYATYGGRGIKFEMDVDDVKFLWILDKAYEMERPSLDRIDSSKNYTFENCRFIELSENSSRANKGKRRLKEDEQQGN